MSKERRLDWQHAQRPEQRRVPELSPRPSANELRRRAGAVVPNFWVTDCHHNATAGRLVEQCQAGVMDRKDPHPVADERTMLDQFLDYHRATLLIKTAGLNREQMNRRRPPSDLTLGGLLKHLALVEDDWIHVRFCGRPELEPWASAPWDEDRDWEFHTAERDDPEELRALYSAACERSRRAVAEAHLDDLSAGRDREGRQ